MSQQAKREDEMAYTTWGQSCQDPAVIDGEVRQCRRPVLHDGEHASGFGKGYREWGSA